MLYHQLALRLALEGYDVTGIGPRSVNAKLQREIEDAGGTFRNSAISEISGGDTALAVLESGRPFQALSWSARHRIHISAERHSPASPVWKCAVITYPEALAQAVLPDIIEQVLALLASPPCAQSVRYSTVPGGRSYRRSRWSSGAGTAALPEGEQLHDQPLEGVEVRPTAHGHGVFATRAHHRGERVMKTSGVRLDHQTEHSIQLTLQQHLEPRFPVRLINHSCEPNLGVKTTPQGLPDFYALRDLHAGEQLTYDYAKTELTHLPRSNQALEFSLDCYCGEASCRGQLGYYATLPASHKRRYAGFISAYLLALDAAQRPPSSARHGEITEPTA